MVMVALLDVAMLKEITYFAISLQIHPSGNYVVSRNTSSDEQCEVGGFIE